MDIEHSSRIMEGVLANPIDIFLFLCIMNVATYLGLMTLICGIEPVKLFGNRVYKNNAD